MGIYDLKIGNFRINLERVDVLIPFQYTTAVETKLLKNLNKIKYSSELSIFIKKCD